MSNIENKIKEMAVTEISGISAVTITKSCNPLYFRKPVARATCDECRKEYKVILPRENFQTTLPTRCPNCRNEGFIQYINL